MQNGQKWISRIFGLATLCLGLLILFEATGRATAVVRAILMTGIVVAGTVVWLIQARRKCPECGEPYGYRFRIVNANICRKCGGEFSDRF